MVGGIPNLFGIYCLFEEKWGHQQNYVSKYKKHLTLRECYNNFGAVVLFLNT